MNRSLEAVSVEGYNKKPGKPPRMEWLSISSLIVDERYQRSMERSGTLNVVRIAQNFEWRKFSPVIVSPSAKGLYSIIDGQHRSTAALSCGYDRVPCYIVDATPEEAASIFSAVNGMVTRLGNQAIYKAARMAGEPWATAIDRACDAAGILVRTSNASSKDRKPYDTIAVARMKWIVQAHGENVLRALLVSLRGAADSASHNFFSGNRMVEWARILVSRPDWIENPERIGSALSTMQIAFASLDRVARDIEAVLAGKVTPRLQLPSKQTDKRSIVQDLARRNFTKSMIAAKTGLPYAEVDSLLKESDGA